MPTRTRAETRRRLQRALDQATQPSVKAELRKRLQRVSGGGTTSGKAAFAEAERLAQRRRKMQARKR
jgi:hypothetical protein